MENVLPGDFDELEDEEKIEVLEKRIELADSPLEERMLEELLRQYD